MVVIIWVEMMLGDIVIVVYFDDECYCYLVGISLVYLFVDWELVIVVDEYVDFEFGIGVVKVIFVYDFNDFEIGVCY